MQYAFSYYYYLMSERRAFDPEAIFDEFDTDNSGTWSDREIRTLLTRLNELPLTLEALDGFEQDLKNCAAGLPEEYSKGISTPSYERYVDSTLVSARSIVPHIAKTL
jgi:UDP-N-acetylglucosamine-lysosomal-enzyme